MSKEDGVPAIGMTLPLLRRIIPPSECIAAERNRIGRQLT
jgi:hypothetical protein